MEEEKGVSEHTMIKMMVARVESSGERLTGTYSFSPSHRTFYISSSEHDHLALWMVVFEPTL